MSKLCKNLLNKAIGKSKKHVEESMLLSEDAITNEPKVSLDVPELHYLVTQRSHVN